MTGSRPTASSTDASTAVVFRRVVGAEWTRLLSVRSTWWILLVATALMTFIGAAAGSDHTGVDPAPIWLPAQFAIVPAQFAFLLIVVLGITSEYATGAIRSTLQWVPRRGVLFVARTLVPVAFVTGCGVVVAAATNLVAWSFLGAAAEVVAQDIAAGLGRIALVVAFGSVLSVGIGLFLRSTAGSLVALFLLIFALPVALGNTGVPSLVAISDALPGRAIVSLIVVDEVELTTREVAMVMSAWTTGAVLVGGWSLLRRDTT